MREKNRLHTGKIGVEAGGEGKSKAIFSKLVDQHAVGRRDADDGRKTLRKRPHELSLAGGARGGMKELRRDTRYTD